MMRTDPIGLYIHVPFCLKKCNYCDFSSFVKEDRAPYVNALLRDIDSYKGKCIHVDTVFFGGGTPSLLSKDEMALIFKHVKEAFILHDDSEITLEANPKTLTEDKLRAYIDLGINRVSMGLQSIHENELKKLGRIHSFEDFLSTYETVRSCGIDNINVDLMYGIPEQTKESFEKTLRRVTMLSPSHISVYGLILEEGTPLFASKDDLILPSEDEECDMYYLARDILVSCGYSHYEVSNYSKFGRECRHNLKYWRDEEYIGVGLSAYSYYEGRRFGKSRSFESYLSDPLLIDESESVDSKERKYEYVMLRTRLSEGFSLEEYKGLFGEDFAACRSDMIKTLSDGGYVKIENGRFSFTDKGLYVGNSLLTELI